MAKRRKKQAAQASKFSPRRYIKERARNFPIEKCIYSPDWQESGLCQILIVRLQPSGSFLTGLFLVDTWCLGVKNAMYNVNLDDYDLNELIEKINSSAPVALQECEYKIVHNIIYGAIQYAEDLGFSPHSDFNIASYILEEDDDDIELIEFEFGKDGKPCFVSGPYDNVQKIVSTLERSVGNGNYDLQVGGLI